MNHYEFDLLGEGALDGDYFVLLYFENDFGFESQLPIYLKKGNWKLMVSELIKDTQNIVNAFEFLTIVFVSVIKLKL